MIDFSSNARHRPSAEPVRPRDMLTEILLGLRLDGV
jgi:hypothetical protein